VKRRHFIGASAASIFLPSVPQLCFSNAAGIAQEHGDVFFDDRFPRAHLTAVTWAGPNRLTPVQGDVTAVWGSGLSQMTRARPLRLRGVTTQSFLFCLRILAEEQASLDVEARRLDRDLWQWTILTTPKLTTESHHA
jgi:hypothetical protein